MTCICVRISTKGYQFPHGEKTGLDLFGENTGDKLRSFFDRIIEWDWDDGSKSLHDSDCEPYQPGTKIERRFSSEHYYRRAGNYNIRAALKAQDKVVAANGFRLVVRQGLPTGRGDDDAANGASTIPRP